MASYSLARPPPVWRTNNPSWGMTPAPDGIGYWLVASDGGVFGFGDARFYGSTGNDHRDQPVVGVATPGAQSASK